MSNNQLLINIKVRLLLKLTLQREDIPVLEQDNMEGTWQLNQGRDRDQKVIFLTF